MGKYIKAIAAAAFLATLVLISVGAYVFVVEPGITVSGDEAENGTVTGYGEYDRFERVRLEAVPDPGYRFMGWFEGSELVSSEAEYGFLARKDIKIDARFELITYKVSVTTSGGRASYTGVNSYVPGAAVTLTATPLEGYNFVKWSCEGTETTETSITFAMPSHNVNATCTVEGIPCTITVDKSTNVTSVTGSGTYKYGSNIPLSAVAADGYFISEWKRGTDRVGYNTSTLTYEVKGDATVTAYAQKYTGASFTIAQKGYASPYLFNCTDEYSSYSSDSWSAEGYDKDNNKYDLSCNFTETSDGKWDLRLEYPSDIVERNTIKVKITHRSEFGEGVVFRHYVTLDAYSWEYELTKDGTTKNHRSVIFLKLSEGTYNTEKEYADAWNAAYVDSSSWDLMVTDDSTARIIANHIKGITEGCGETDDLQCALNFVNNAIFYGTDSEIYGVAEKEDYFATAYQTLYNHRGDCEDTSILFAVLAEQLGYDAYLISVPEHMVAGVKLGDTGGNFPTHPGIHFCETTSDGAAWEVGVIPPKTNLSSYNIVDVSIS